jgi:hypothetical protein
LAAVPRPPTAAVAHTAADLIPTDDPFPIRRVRGPVSAELLKELEPGPVVRLPRTEFEARVRAAGRVVAYAKNGARVIDATYTATLDGGDLIGTAELGILNAHDVTGFVPLDPLRLALRSAKWGDGGSAILAVAPGSTAPAVWVDRAGRRVLRLDWSLTGTTEPGERRFELRTPPCPAAVLELTVPVDQVPTVPADVLLTGPFEVPGQPGRRMWRLRFGGRSKAEFAIRAGGAPGTTALARLVAKYDLAPGQLAATFEYELHPVRGSVGEWVFTADPGLRVTDVATNNRAGWVVEPPRVPNGPRTVRVSLRQPGPGGKVVVSAVAPLPSAGLPRPGLPTDAPLPVVRPRDAVLDDEKLELRFAPGLKLESWSPGDYRLVNAVTPAPGAADQSRILSLTGGLVPPGTNELFRRLPAVQVAPGEAEFTTLERLEWQPGSARSVLVARVGLRVRRGPLFQLVVQPPPGYTIDRSASALDELVANIGPGTAAGTVVELARPLGTGQRADLRLEFRGPGARPGEPLPFPAFAWVSATGPVERDGWLSIITAPEWTATVRPGAGAVPAGLWGLLTVDAPGASAVFTYRGREPDGTVVLAPTRPTVTADARVRVEAPGAEWVATTRLTLTVTGGAIPIATVFVPGPQQDRTWKLLDGGNALVDVVAVPREFLSAMPLFAPVDVRAAVTGARARTGTAGTFWVLRFARPLIGTVVVETTSTGPPVGPAVAELPVPLAISAIAQTTRVEPAPPGTRERVSAALAGDRVTVQCTLQPESPDPILVNEVYLVTRVTGSGTALAAFGGTARAPRGGVLRLFLPPGAEVQGACVDGRWLTPAACAARDPDGSLPVPVPVGTGVRFEVRYRLPVAPGWPTQRVDSPVPRVAGNTPTVHRWWVFGPGVLPGWPARPWETTGSEPPLLGGPLTGEPRALVTRSEDEWVRVGTARTADASAAVLAAVIVVLGVVALRRPVRGAALLGGAVAGAVVVALVTTELGPPWWARVAWPPLCAATVALAVVLGVVALRRRIPPDPAGGEFRIPHFPGGSGGVTPPHTPEGTAPVAALLVLFLVVPVVAAVAQTGAPATVLLTTNGAGREEVVVARATLDRLDALAKPAPPAPVLTGAEYDVRIDGAGAHVVAKFVAHAFGTGDNVVALPLSDARLERATVDGAPAFPTAARPDAYTLAVGGRGRHEIELRFAATVTANGPEREVRFGVPEVPASKLTAVLPGAARLPTVVGRVGRQVTAPTGDRTTVEADLGAVRGVHLRWREGAGGAAVVKVREGCVWDVSETGADLTAAYLVRVEQGTVAGLRFEVPAELEVLRVAARTTEPAGPVPLRDWALAPEKNGTRLLRLDFQAPMAGRFVAVVECRPRKPLTRQPVLRFPRMTFSSASGETDSVYGLRASRVTVDGVGLVGVIDFPPDAFKDFTAIPDLKLDPSAPVRAFRPVQGPVELRPILRAGEPPVVRTATTWHLGPGRADARGTVSWSARDPLLLVEFGLGGQKVLEVRGPEVAAWNQTPGGRVQVWLRAAAREGTVEWTGSTGVAVPAKPGEPVPFDPLHPKVPGARVGSDDVWVRAVAGWTVRADRSRGWHATHDPTGALQFRTEVPGAPALRVHLVQSTPTGK